MIGTTLSHYEITAELGRGGMGIVYKAEDTKLERQVALKVLPAAALASQDDRARFYREAKAAAALNHPNIAQIYQIDEAIAVDADGNQVEASDGPRPFIAMEFIEGGTLEDRIKEGPLKLAEAVRIATQTAEALKAAHAKEIVHRDIKSANIMLTKEGQAKVLDFGLAQTSHSTKLTRMGSTLGTVAYMSPEQARGEEVDNRTDIWALGVILYEMVAGRHPFAGDYEQAVVYSILNEAVEPLTALRTGVPMSLEWIVSKCLAKSADDRYQSTGDLLIDLRNVDVSDVSVLRSTASRTVIRPAAAPAKGRGSLDWKMAGIGLLIGLLLIGIPWWLSDSDVTATGVPVYSHISLPDGLRIEPNRSAPLNLDRTAIAVSPDGSQLVFVGTYGETTSLYRRPLSEDRFERILGTEGAYGVAISPEGTRVAFYADNLLKTVAIEGGSLREVTPVSLPYSMVWMPNGEILFNDDEGSSLMKVAETGGSAQRLDLRLEGSNGESLSDIFLPVSVLPDEDVLAVGRFGTYVIDFTSETARIVDQVETALHALASGHLVYSDGVGLSLAPWDGESFTPLGQPVQLVDSLYQRGLGNRSNFSTSNRGTIAFLKGPDVSQTRLSWLNDDEMEAIEVLDRKRYGAFRISPDGQFVAVAVRSVDGLSMEVYDLSRGTQQSLSAPGYNDFPTWSPDGSVVYWAARDFNQWIIVRSTVGGAAQPDTVYRNNSFPEWISPDGRYIGIVRIAEDNGADVGMLDVENDFAYIGIGNRVDVTEVLSSLSNRGDFVAYTSNQTGDYEVFVQPVPPTGREWQVSLSGGEEPLWAADDQTLYWRNGDVLLRATITYTESGPVFSDPEIVFEGVFENVGGYSIDISPIDDRILMLAGEPMPPFSRIDLITNFPALLENE